MKFRDNRWARNFVMEPDYVSKRVFWKRIVVTFRRCTLIRTNKGTVCVIVEKKKKEKGKRKEKKKEEKAYHNYAVRVDMLRDLWLPGGTTKRSL